MGVESNIRVTAYLKFLCPKKPEQRLMHVACCGKVQKSRFCQHCGAEIQVRTYTVQVAAVCQSDMADEIKEVLCYLRDCSGAIPDDGCDIWYPNCAGAIDEETPGHYDITEEMITAEKTKIARLYAEQIDVLAKYYGSRPQVCFGLVVWEG